MIDQPHCTACGDIHMNQAALARKDNLSHRNACVKRSGRRPHSGWRNDGTVEGMEE